LKPEAAPSSADSSEPNAQQPALVVPPAPPEGAPLDESWKEEYDAQVQAWRAQSAEAREKAEKERLKWEAIRAQEKEEAAKRKAAGIVDEPAVSSLSQSHAEGWEKVGAPSTSGSVTAASSKPADSSDLQSDSENVSIHPVSI